MRDLQCLHGCECPLRLTGAIRIGQQQREFLAAITRRQVFAAAEGVVTTLAAPGTSADAAMSLADGLLYAAKNGGRDRAEVENLITGERVTVQPPPVSERPS